MATHLGYGLWFGEDEVNVVGARAAGVKGINLKEDDFVVSGEILQQSDSIVLFTQRGAVKRMSLSEFEDIPCKTRCRNAKELKRILTVL